MGQVNESAIRGWFTSQGLQRHVSLLAAKADWAGRKTEVRSREEPLYLFLMLNGGNSLDLYLSQLS